jgi:carboxypeptidase C (cathepsin A)
MKNLSSILISLLCAVTGVAQNRSIPTDTTIVTEHVATINGIKFTYTATTGMQPVWNEKGEPIATLHYTYYKRNGISDMAKRPLMISFNGGPGSASAWMHIAYTGPKLLNIDDEGYPVQPYGIKDNPFSVLDVTDILFVNPVNTGYSRTIPATGEEVKRDKFFGINADITYLGEWINTFVGRHNRWLSPKYLIGESYGGTRVSGLAYELQEKHWMFLNGVILVSPADYNIFTSDSPVSSALNLPYFAATAWYHQALSADFQSRKLQDLLSEVEEFTLDILMPALARGGSLPAEEKEDIATRMSAYSGLSTKSILQYDLVVPTAFFWKELLRDEKGLTVGRLDSRYLGLDRHEAGESPDYNTELMAWLHAFTPAINYFMREQLKFKTDMKYNMFGPVHPWDKQNNNTRENLRKAMAQNPYLNVLVQSGYYDGATTYFGAKYTLWQIDSSGKLQHRMKFHGYESGHMMYLRKEDLKLANDHLREFIKNTLMDGKPAKY